LWDFALTADDVGHAYSITIREDFDPRETDEYGDNVTVTKVDNGDGTWNVTVSGDAVLQGENGECDTSSWPWSCPETAGANLTSFFGEASDFEQWEDHSQWVDFDGMNAWTNIEASDIPPQVIGDDPFTLRTDLANSHFLHGQSTPFRGFYDLVVPNQFLIDMGIDDPSTLLPSGVSTAIGSGSVTVKPGPSSLEVDVSGITFSPRKLKIAPGRITPTRTKITKGKRSAHSVKLTFGKSKPRGSHLKHYEARCQASHQTTRTATGKHSPLTVKGLTAGIGYRCQVRAKAKVGYGAWSKKHTVRK
jgi:hypothetical protein